jgi:hypothetical protein
VHRTFGQLTDDPTEVGSGIRNLSLVPVRPNKTIGRVDAINEKTVAIAAMSIERGSCAYNRLHGLSLVTTRVFEGSGDELLSSVIGLNSFVESKPYRARGMPHTNG